MTQKGLTESPFIGSLWETLIFAELRKLQALSEKPNQIWFYRDQQQVEADFLILGGGHARLIECKWRSQVQAKDFNELLKIRSYAEQKKLPDFTKSESYVVCRVESEASLGDRKYAFPITELSRLF